MSCAGWTLLCVVSWIICALLLNGVLYAVRMEFSWLSFEENLHFDRHMSFLRHFAPGKRTLSIETSSGDGFIDRVSVLVVSDCEAGCDEQRGI